MFVNWIVSVIMQCFVFILYKFSVYFPKKTTKNVYYTIFLTMTFIFYFSEVEEFGRLIGKQMKKEGTVAYQKVQLLPSLWVFCLFLVEFCFAFKILKNGFCNRQGIIYFD